MAEQRTTVTGMYPSTDPAMGPHIIVMDDDTEGTANPNKRKRAESRSPERDLQAASLVTSDDVIGLALMAGDDEFIGEPVPTDEEVKTYCRKLRHKMVAAKQDEISMLRRKLHDSNNENEKQKKQKCV